MISKNQIKFIKSLHLKKFRKEEGLFLVEGEKSILELMNSNFEILNIYISREVFDKYRDEFLKFDSITDIVEVDNLSKISNFEFNDTGIAVVKQKENLPLEIKGEVVLVLDDVRDPGNLGTIIRTADWYGVKNIICSDTTAELYNNKVIAASMGSFTRVEIFYTNLENFFENNLKNNKIPVLGALLEGTNVHSFKFPNSGIILAGNESNGISESLFKYITDKITIPRYGDAESLNVSMATGIILDNWKRMI